MFTFKCSITTHSDEQILSLQAAPFVIKREESNGYVKYEGLCITMLKEIAKSLNFRYVELTRQYMNTLLIESLT